MNPGELWHHAYNDEIVCLISSVRGCNNMWQVVVVKEMWQVRGMQRMRIETYPTRYVNEPWEKIA